MENRIFLNRYRLSLGRNGSPVEMHRAPNARTYRAHEINTGREGALTIVSPAPSDLGLLEKLGSEANASEELNHINIPRLYDFGWENDELIYVSEYWEGHTASAWVEARGPLTVAAVLRVALQVADAMNATVFQRLYHPALNPDNILFVAGQTGEGDWPPIKILNWHGPMPALEQPLDARAESAARFAAPEQLHEGKVDVRSEVYSLGATIWFLLTGLPPTADAPGGLQAATSKLRGVPKIVRHLLERMVHLDPRERPQDPVALASYLQTCLARVERRAKMERRSGIPLMTQPRVAVPRTPMPAKRLTAALAVMLVVMLGVLFLTQSLISRPSAQLTAKTNQLPESAPNESNLPNESDSSESMVPEKEAPAKAHASETSSPDAVAAEPATSHDELISLPPSPAAAEVGIASETDAVPADQMKTSESARVASEPSPPAEGPSEKNEPQIASTADAVPREDSHPNEVTSGATVATLPVAESNEAHPAAAVPSSTELPESSDMAETKPIPTATPTAVVRKTLLAKQAATKATTKSLRDSSKTRLAKGRARSRHTVKRAEPLPKLRVGSNPAEYVGTTRGGDWILSVDSTGETIIVPPPPGYGP